MAQIILTEEEKKVIEKHLKGELNAFFAEERERDVIDKVIDDAKQLMAELNAYDELDSSLVEWYYNKYKEQNK